MDSLKKIGPRTLIAAAVILLLAIAILLLLRSGSNEPKESLVRYWQEQGLGEGDAKDLAREGRVRIEEPATMAAFDQVPPEEIIGTILQEKGDINGNNQQTKDVLQECIENNCPLGKPAPGRIRATRSFVFWETNISVIVLTQYCSGSRDRASQPLFSELLFLRDRWIPTYILQTLDQAKIQITEDGREALRRETADFQRLCRT